MTFRTSFLHFFLFSGASKMPAFLLGALLLGLNGNLSAQNRFILRAPQELKNEFSVSFRVMSPVDVTFSGIGNISGPNSDQGFFSNGLVRPDSTYDSAGEQTVVFDDKTSFWQFAQQRQVGNLNDAGEFVPAYNGSFLQMTHYSGRALEAGISNEESGMGLGNEFQYIRYFGQGRRFGILIAFGYSGMDAIGTGEYSAELQRTDYLFPTSDNLSEAPGNPGLFTGTFQRPRIPTPQNPLILISTEPSLSIPQDAISEGVTASGNWEMKAGIYTLRLGGIYNLRLGRRFEAQFGIGVSGLLMSTNFSSTETINAPEGSLLDGARSPSVFLENTSEDMSVGGWVDASARYLISNRVNAFAGFQYQTGDDYTHSAEDRTLDLKTDSLMSVKAGFGFSF